MAIGLGLVLVLLGATGLQREEPVTAVSDPLPSASNAPATTAAPAPSAARPSCSVQDGPVAIDFDGDGCPDPVRVEDGGVVVVGTQRFAAGETGDRVAVGDWNCDGAATLAVLRPATGAVFVFDTWANRGADVSVSPTRTITGAVDVVARERGDGCSTLVVIRDDGTEQEIT